MSKEKVIVGMSGGVDSGDVGNTLSHS